MPRVAASSTDPLGDRSACQSLPSPHAPPAGHQLAIHHHPLLHRLLVGELVRKGGVRGGALARQHACRAGFGGLQGVERWQASTAASPASMSHSLGFKGRRRAGPQLAHAPSPPRPGPPCGSKATAGVAQMAACSLSAAFCCATRSLSTPESRRRSAPGMPPCVGMGGVGGGKRGMHAAKIKPSTRDAVDLILPPAPPLGGSTPATAAPPRPARPAHRQRDQVPLLARALADGAVSHNLGLPGAGDGQALLNRGHSHLIPGQPKTRVRGEGGALETEMCHQQQRQPNPRCLGQGRQRRQRTSAPARRRTSMVMTCSGQ